MTEKITSSRLTYRPLQTADASELFRLHSDPEVMKFIREPNTQIQQAKEWIEKFLTYSTQIQVL